jgi:hypothetical protein
LNDAAMVLLDDMRSQAMSPDLTKKLQAFDTLPNDSVVADPVAAAVLNISLRTLRRNDPVRSIKLSARRIGRRVGDIRALLQGQPAAA